MQRSPSSESNSQASAASAPVTRRSMHQIYDEAKVKMSGVVNGAARTSVLESSTLTPTVYQEVVADKKTGLCRIALISIVESTIYNVFISMVVSSNIFLVVYETDAGDPRKGQASWVRQAGWIMLTVFTVDSCLRIASLGINFVKSYADLFDVAIVVSDWAFEIATLFFSLDEVASLTAFKSLRILRVFRIIRRFLVFRELYLMMKGLITAMRTIMFASFLLTLVIMMFAILAVQYVHPVHSRLEHQGLVCDRCKLAYSTVADGMLTIFSTVIAGDSWGLINNVIIQESPFSAVIIISGTIIIQLGLLNLIIAVIVDRAHAARVDDTELVHIMKQEELVSSFKSLKRVFETIDVDGSGTLSMEELVQAFDTCDLFRHQLNVMDITQEDLTKIFDILDKDGDGEVSYHEFVNQLHVIKNANPHTLLVLLTHQAELSNRAFEMRLDKLLKQVQCVGEFAEKSANEVTKHFEKAGRAVSTVKDEPFIRQASPSSAEQTNSSCRTTEFDLPDRDPPEDFSVYVSGSGSEEAELALATGLPKVLVSPDKVAMTETVVAEAIQPLIDDIISVFSKLLVSFSEVKQSINKHSDRIIRTPIHGANLPICYASLKDLPDESRKHRLNFNDQLVQLDEHKPNFHEKDVISNGQLVHWNELDKQHRRPEENMRN